MTERAARIGKSKLDHYPATLMFAPPEKARVLGPALGTVMTVSCLWLLAKCARLITGRKVHGGLMGPGAFRVVGWFFLLLPVAGLFTGYFTDNPTGALLQTAANVATFTGLRALARIREQASGG